jgi:hypothetical protein
MAATCTAMTRPVLFSSLLALSLAQLLAQPLAAQPTPPANADSNAGLRVPLWSTAQDNAQTRFRLGLEMQASEGLVLSGAVASRFGAGSAAGVMFSAGEQERELILNGAWAVSPRDRLLLSLGQLQQNLSFDFASGADTGWLTQSNWAASWRRQLGAGWVRSVELTGYGARTRSTSFGAREHTVDNADVFELWNDPRRIAGGELQGWQGRVRLRPWAKTQLELGAGRENLGFDHATGLQSHRRGATTAQWTQYLDDGVLWTANVDNTAAGERMGLGLERPFAGGRAGVDLSVMRARLGLRNDTMLRLSWSRVLGDGSSIGGGGSTSSRSGPGATEAPLSLPSLLDDTLRRPTVLPRQVLARLDNTATRSRLVMIDKAGLPAGSTIDTTSGAIRVPLGTVVTGIAGITVNGQPFSNISGAFSVSGSQLTILPRALTAPTSGLTDAYVITANNQAGGTTLISMSVARGSVRIVSITVRAGALPMPVLGSFSVAKPRFGDAPLTLQPPTSSSTGAFSFSSSNTAVATVSGNTLTIVGAGVTTLTAQQAGTATHQPASTSTTVTVAAKAPSLGRFEPLQRAYGSGSFTLSPPASDSPAPFTYSSSNTAVATVAGDTVTLVGAGTTTITAQQAASANHEATSTSTTLTVSASAPTLGTLAALSRRLGDAAFSLTPPSSNSGGAFSYSSSNTAVATVSGATVTLLGAGSTTLTATQAADGPYTSASTSTTLTVAPALQAPTLGSIAPLALQLGDTSVNLATPTSNSSGSFTITSSNPAVATVSGNTLSIVGAGTSTLSFEQAAAGAFTSGSTSTTVTVTPRTPTVSALPPLSKAISEGSFTLPVPNSTSSSAFSWASSNPAVATVSGNTVTLTGVGTATLTATQPAAGIYTSASTSFGLTVSTSVPTLGSFPAINKTWGDAAFTLSAPSSNSSGSFSFLSTNPAVATISGNTVTLVGAGVTTLTAQQAAASGFGPGTVSTTLTVAAVAPTLGSWNVSSKTFGEAPFSVTPPSSSSSGAFTLSSSNPAVATVSGNTVTLVGVGSTTLTAQQAAAGPYTAASSSTTLVVGAAAPSLSGFGALSASFGAAPFSLSPPSSNSAGAFSYSSSNPAVATVSGSTVTLVGVGSTIITAQQAAAGNYSAGSITATLSVSAAGPSLGSFSVAPVTFGAAPFSLTPPSSNSAGAFSYSSSNPAVATVSGNTVTVVGAGSTTLTASQAASGNYGAGSATASFTVQPLAPTLSGFGNLSPTFGDAPLTLTVPTSTSAGSFSYSSSNPAVATVSGNTLTLVGAGSATLTATQAANGNYSAGSITASLSVAKGIPALGSFATLTRTFGDSAFSLTPPNSTSTGAFSYTSSNPAVATVSGGTVTIVGIGSTTLTASQAESDNHLAASTTTTLTVTPQAPTITGFSAPGKTYGDSSFALTPPTSNSAGAFSYSSSNTAVATVSGSTVTIVGAGTATLTVSQAADGNYTAGTATTTLSVAKATPVVGPFADVVANSNQYDRICLGSNQACGSASGQLHIPYTLELGPALNGTTNPADVWTESTIGLTVPVYGRNSVRPLDALTSSDSRVANASAGAMPLFTAPIATRIAPRNLRSNITLSFPDWPNAAVPIVSTITINRAETANFTAASTSFTLTINPTNVGTFGVCYNGGLMLINGGSQYCQCPARYAGSTWCETVTNP